jgi:ATP phosphoribosyltransferase
MSVSQQHNAPVRLAFPSKGRLKEQTEAWLAESGFKLRQVGGERSYSAVIDGLPNIEPVLLSAGDIAQSVARGDVHLGVTGEDLLHELNPGLSEIEIIRPLGFGRADLVVATPRAWLDVTSIADLEDYAAERYAKTGQRVRVATKYMRSAAAFFAEVGLVHYRLIESLGATEAAPAAGEAEAIVDITSSGATLTANGLLPLRDGLILRSQAVLAASARAPWSPYNLEVLSRLINVLEARSRAAAQRVLVVSGYHPSFAGLLASANATRLDPSEQSQTLARFAVPTQAAVGLAEALLRAGATAAEITTPSFLFLPESSAHLAGVQRLIAAQEGR